MNLDSQFALLKLLHEIHQHSLTEIELCHELIIRLSLCVYEGRREKGVI